MSSNTSLTIRDRINSPAQMQEIARALPKHMSADRMARVAITALTKTPALNECEPASFFKCLLDLSAMGLEPDGRRAHLIPFRNNKRNVTECQLIVDYKGLVELAYRSGEIASIHTDVFCEGEEFVEDRGKVISHRIDRSKPRGKPLGAYCIVTFKSGSEKHEVMGLHEIEAIRKRSRSGSSGPWVTDWSEMARKGLALDTPIPTVDGWKEMGELVVGDRVFDMEGRPCNVMAVSEVKRLRCFEVTFANGDKITCDDEHRWVAKIGTEGEKSVKHHNAWPVRTINEMYEAKQQGRPVVVPVAGVLETEEVELPIDPWLFGYWLGNGSRRKAIVHAHGQDADHVMRMIEERTPYAVGAVRQKGDANCRSIGIPGGLLQDIRDSGVGEKTVPAIYMRASAEQRLSLLQGLIDSDGHVCRRRGRAHFGSTEKHLADCVAELAASLGNVVMRSKRFCNGFGKTVLFYNVCWQPVQPPATSPRKLANYRPRKLRAYRAIKSIEIVPTVETKCIAVDSPTRTYLAGRHMTPTHNTVFRRASKWLPLSSEILEAFERDGDQFEQPPARAKRPSGMSFDDLKAALSHETSEPTQPPVLDLSTIPAFEAALRSCATEEEIRSLTHQAIDLRPEDEDWGAQISVVADEHLRAIRKAS